MKMRKNTPRSKTQEFAIRVSSGTAEIVDGKSTGEMSFVNISVGDELTISFTLDEIKQMHDFVTRNTATLPKFAKDFQKA